MVKRCLLVVLFPILISMTFGAEKQATRLSIDEMKNIKGGAGLQSCSVLVRCDARPEETCIEVPQYDDIGIYIGVKCTTFHGFHSYYVLGCGDGSFSKCALDGADEDCTRYWICSNRWSWLDLMYHCDKDYNKTYTPRCNAHN